MPVFGFGGSRRRPIRGLGSDDGQEVLMSEYSSDSKDDLRLMMIHKKIELAARMGDWELMNELDSEFKKVKAAIRAEAVSV